MKKPLMVMRQEFIDSLANCINSSGLPLVMVEPILSNVLNEIRALINQQYEKERSEYETSLKSAEGES